MRCPSCGGLNPAGADWCGQCLRRFTAPPPPPPVAPRDAPAAARQVPEFREGAGGPVTVSEQGITWRCRLCDHDNPLAASVCEVCGSPFSATVKEPEEELPERDPNTAALVSLFFPGAGHAYLGRWPEAIGRAILSVWVAAVALVAALAERVPGAMFLAVSFALAAFLLWVVASHDAYRAARREEDLSILRGRRYMYVTFALMGLLMLGLVTAVTAAR